MPKTTRDVVTRALQKIGVASTRIPVQAADFEIGKAVYEGIISELYTKEGFTDLDDADAVPDWAFLGLSEMLAEQLAPDYGRPPPNRGWFWGMKRLRRHQFPDDRGSQPAKSEAFY